MLAPGKINEVLPYFYKETHQGMHKLISISPKIDNVQSNKRIEGVLSVKIFRMVRMIMAGQDCQKLLYHNY